MASVRKRRSTRRARSPFPPAIHRPGRLRKSARTSGTRPDFAQAPPLRRVTVLVNESAGGARHAGNVRRLLTLLEQAEADVRTVPPAQLPAEARRIVAEGAQRVGIAGGDGTMRTAAEALAGTAA
ncbi:MAG: diacylglycerol kinase family protein, partial [Longimicrobiales bacterium]